MAVATSYGRIREQAETINPVARFGSTARIAAKRPCLDALGLRRAGRWETA